MGFSYGVEGLGFQGLQGLGSRASAEAVDSVFKESGETYVPQSFGFREADLESGTVIC